MSIISQNNENEKGDNKYAKYMMSVRWPTTNMRNADFSFAGLKKIKAETLEII